MKIKDFVKNYLLVNKIIHNFKINLKTNKEHFKMKDYKLQIWEILKKN